MMQGAIRGLREKRKLRGVKNTVTVRTVSCGRHLTSREEKKPHESSTECLTGELKERKKDETKEGRKTFAILDLPGP